VGVLVKTDIDYSLPVDKLAMAKWSLTCMHSQRNSENVLAILLALGTARVPFQLSSTFSLSVLGVVGKGYPSSPGKNYMLSQYFIAENRAENKLFGCFPLVPTIGILTALLECFDF